MLLADIRFAAMAMVSCASRLIDPRDTAPLENRLTISEAVSTSSSGTGASASLKSSRPRMVHSCRLRLSMWLANCSNVAKSSDLTECWSFALVYGFHMWYSPSRRHW